MKKYNFITKELLIEEYSKKINSIRKIAKKLKCSYTTVRKKLIKFGILLKTRKEAIKIYGHPRFGEHHNTETKKLIGLKIKIAHKNGIYKGHLKKLHKGFRGRPKTKGHKKKLSLAHGGTGVPYENSDYPEEFNEKLRNKIRRRYNHECQGKDCNITEKEHLLVYGKKLAVHHIDYDKQKNKETNLICLCHRCNIRVNFNRDYWFAYFTYLIEIIRKIR